MTTRVRAAVVTGVALALLVAWLSLREQARVSQTASRPGSGPARRGVSSPVRGATGATDTPPATPSEAMPTGARVAGAVEDASGGVVVGAAVTVTASDDAETGTVIAAGITDDVGRFDIPVRPGLVRIFATADGYSRAATEVLAPARELRLVLSPGAELSGRVIEHGTGRPIEGARVIAQKQSGGMDSESARTGAGGTFRLVHLTPGGYELFAVDGLWRSGSRWAVAELAHASAPVVLEAVRAARVEGVVEVDGQPCAQGLVRLEGPVSAVASVGSGGAVSVDGVTAGSYAVTVRCTGAQDLREDLAVAAAVDPPRRRWDLSRGSSVSGIVRAPDGSPAPDIPISVARTMNVFARSGPSTGAGCLSGPDGRFACRGLDAGAYTVSASGEQGPRSESVAVAVGKNTVSGIELHLNASASIRATVSSERGAPARRAEVVVWRGENEVATGHQIGPGAFLIPNLPLGLYEVRAGRDPASAAMPVRLDRHGDVVDVRLVAPVATAVITGRVLDDAGRPVADAWIRAARAPLPIPEADGAFAPTVTDLDGRFRLTELQAGRYTVFATTAAGSGETTDVEAGRDVEVRVRAFAEISGVARNAAGEPVTSFLLSCRGSDGVETRRHVFDPTGSWRLPWLPPGDWQIRIADASGGAAAQEMTLSPGERARLSLKLSTEP